MAMFVSGLIIGVIITCEIIGFAMLRSIEARHFDKTNNAQFSKYQNFEIPEFSIF